MKKDLSFMELFNTFIIEKQRGKSLKRNGQKTGNGTIKNYKATKLVLDKFCTTYCTELRIANLSKCTQKEFQKEIKYWKGIYRKLLKYLYRDLNHFDNYVGSIMKNIRTFFGYLAVEKGIDTKSIAKTFYVIKEEIPILVLSPEQLNYLIYNKAFDDLLSESLKRVKDIFVFGCTVGLRFSDLMSLKKNNLEKIFDDYYLKVLTKKTGTYIRIKLPSYAIDILHKYRNRHDKLLPPILLHTMNKKIRQIGEMAGWTSLIGKNRSKQGRSKHINHPLRNKPYRFCDLLTSHTMRKTAITTLLAMGMPEQLVRRISGHTPNSKEFYRYVKYSQEIFEKETDAAFEKLKKHQFPS